MSKTKNLSNLPFLHYLCSSDEKRPVMCHVFIDNGWAVASDAHVLCAIKLSSHTSLEESEIQSMDGKLIHKDVWKLICEKSLIIHPNKDEIEVIFENGVESSFNYSNKVNNYPSWRSISNDDDLYKESVEKIGVNLSRFNKVATFFKKTFGSDKLDFHFSTEVSKILISNGEADVHCLIMPNVCETKLTKGQVNSDLS